MNTLVIKIESKMAREGKACMRFPSKGKANCYLPLFTSLKMANRRKLFANKQGFINAVREKLKEVKKDAL
ncbi:MAG: hypothetical protein AB1630_13170 [bacterium]